MENKTLHRLYLVVALDTMMLQADERVDLLPKIVSSKNKAYESFQKKNQKTFSDEDRKKHVVETAIALLEDMNSPSPKGNEFKKVLIDSLFYAIGIMVDPKDLSTIHGIIVTMDDGGINFSSYDDRKEWNETVQKLKTAYKSAKQMG